MKFIAIKTDDGTIKGKLAFYCRMLHVSRQGFYKYLSVKDRPWKYQTLADTMLEIHAEDVCNDTYGRVRMFQALTLKQPDGIPIPSERTVYRVMEKIGLSHRPKRNPKGITKADREARKSEDLLKRNFTSEKPLEKCVTDITEIKASDAAEVTEIAETSGPHVGIYTGMTVLIITGFFVRIRKNGIRFIDLFEFHLCFFIAGIHIRVIFLRQGSIRFFNRCLICSFWHS